MSRVLLLAMALFLPAAVAVAQPIRGLYIGGETGANFTGSLTSSQENTKIYTDTGPLGLVALGWGFGNGLRAEIEGSYRSNSISGISTLRTNGALLPLTNVDGSAATYAIMANVEYDIPLNPLGLAIRPYIGAGVGYGWLDFGNATGDGVGRFLLPQNNTYNGPDLVTFGSAGAFAYQAIIGASLPIRILPGLDATMEYRFFGMARADVPVSRVATTTTLIGGAIPSNETRNGFTVQDNAVLIGVRYTFGAP